MKLRTTCGFNCSPARLLSTSCSLLLNIARRRCGEAVVRTPLGMSRSARKRASETGRSDASTKNRTATTNDLTASPSLVLPSYEDTFMRPPRLWTPQTSMWARVAQWFVPQRSKAATNAPFSSTMSHWYEEHKRTMPRPYTLLGDAKHGHRRGYRHVQRVVVLGIHGWYSQSIFKNVLGAITYVNVLH